MRVSLISMPSTTPGKPISTKPLTWSVAGAPLDDYVEGPPSLNTADELAKQVRLKNAERNMRNAYQEQAGSIVDFVHVLANTAP